MIISLLTSLQIHDALISWLPLQNRVDSVCTYDGRIMVKILFGKKWTISRTTDIDKLMQSIDSVHRPLASIPATARKFTLTQFGVLNWKRRFPSIIHFMTKFIREFSSFSRFIHYDSWIFTLDSCVNMHLYYFFIFIPIKFILNTFMCNKSELQTF